MSEIYTFKRRYAGKSSRILFLACFVFLAFGCGCDSKARKKVRHPLQTFETWRQDRDFTSWRNSPEYSQLHTELDSLASQARIRGDLSHDEALRLMELIRHDRWDIRTSAVEKIGLASSDKLKELLLPSILNASKDLIPAVREQAALTFRVIGDQRAVPHLQRLLKDSDEYVAWEAYVTLTNLVGRGEVTR